ncbi:hypothetical protein K402DRAFT_405368 [Aulographum hederae CBS 113979]|uniref:Uncharacterized protein n=1 Tax=Aulographum hederae CBS 113979 TaxID=1176131 RepID=A0A6G1GW89_9PEZI|nr:hypothetical protein K402DRAFT_405368 [Aulographum hederae CBS 113979]
MERTEKSSAINFTLEDMPLPDPPTLSSWHKVKTKQASHPPSKMSTEATNSTNPSEPSPGTLVAASLVALIGTPTPDPTKPQVAPIFDNETKELLNPLLKSLDAAMASANELLQVAAREMDETVAWIGQNDGNASAGQSGRRIPGLKFTPGAAAGEKKSKGGSASGREATRNGNGDGGASAVQRVWETEIRNKTLAVESDAKIGMIRLEIALGAVQGATEMVWGGRKRKRRWSGVAGGKGRGSGDAGGRRGRWEDSEKEGGIVGEGGRAADEVEGGEKETESEEQSAPIGGQAVDDVEAEMVEEVAGAEREGVAPVAPVGAMDGAADEDDDDEEEWEDVLKANDSDEVEDEIEMEDEWDDVLHISDDDNDGEQKRSGFVAANSDFDPDGHGAGHDFSDSDGTLC